MLRKVLIFTLLVALLSACGQPQPMDLSGKNPDDYTGLWIVENLASGQNDIFKSADGTNSFAIFFKERVGTGEADSLYGDYTFSWSQYDPATGSWSDWQEVTIALNQTFVLPNQTVGGSSVDLEPSQVSISGNVDCVFEFGEFGCLLGYNYPLRIQLAGKGG